MIILVQFFMNFVQAAWVLSTYILGTLLAFTIRGAVSLKVDIDIQEIVIIALYVQVDLNWFRIGSYPQGRTIFSLYGDAHDLTHTSHLLGANYCGEHGNATPQSKRNACS